jgi:hypothetical protein
MAEIWRGQTPDVLKSWVEAIRTEASDELTDWETRFVNDMWDRLDRGSILTQYQQEKLEEIYVEYTS